MLEKSNQVSELLSDLALNYRAKAILMKVTGGVEWADLEVDKGVASLSGLVRSVAVRNYCEKALLNLEGIKSVNNYLGVRGWILSFLQIY